MKLTEKLELAEKEDRVWWSFEYFPPRTAQASTPDAKFVDTDFSSILQGLQNLLDRIERMRALGPEFIDITWYAGRRTMRSRSNASAHSAQERWW